MCVIESNMSITNKSKMPRATRKHVGYYMNHVVLVYVDRKTVHVLSPFSQMYGRRTIWLYPSRWININTMANIGG